MADMVFKEIKALDRGALINQMAGKLDLISGEMGITPAGIAWRAGIDEKRVKLIASGKRKMKWSEYLSILLVLWDNEKGHEIVEEMGLFPEELRRAIAADRSVRREGRGAIML